MELNGINCPNCGSTNIEYNAAERSIQCNQCGSHTTYSRATMAKNKNVILAMRNAIEFFCDGNFEEAYHYALETLNLFSDYAPALYIVSYYNEVKKGQCLSIKQFLESIMRQDATPLEFDEIRDLMRVFVASKHLLIDYEKEFIYILATNMQAEQDKKELAACVEAVCPYVIQHQRSIDFLDEEMAGYYADLAAHIDIPKTCVALLIGIQKNPESPYAGNTFSFHAKTQYFYEHYVVPVGTIIQHMKQSALKNQLAAKYQQMQQSYTSRMTNNQ